MQASSVGLMGEHTVIINGRGVGEDMITPMVILGGSKFPENTDTRANPATRPNHGSARDL